MADMKRGAHFGDAKALLPDRRQGCQARASAGLAMPVASMHNAPELKLRRPMMPTLSPPSPSGRAQRTVQINTFGCRVNKYDEALLRGELVARGYALSEPGESFDTVILNTCTVTGAADQATRRLVRRLRRDHPDATLVVTGCYAEVAGPRLARELEVDLVVPNRDKPDLVNRLDAHFGFDVCDVPAIDPIPDPGRHTRFFFKVQEGCDVRCAFCIIPDARGTSRSLPPDDVVRTVERAVARGHREVILAGIHLGGYGRDYPLV